MARRREERINAERDKRIRKTPTDSPRRTISQQRDIYRMCAIYILEGVPAIWIIRFEAEARMKYK